MSYAIISVGGKQYRVREGERLLVDRVVGIEDGATFTPPVLLVGGDGATAIAPADVVVTAKVLMQAKGPKIRIGKYKKRTGYKRHTGFRSSLTQIQIESIGAGKKRAASAKAEPVSSAAPAAKVEAPSAAPASAASLLPEGYAKLTIAALKTAVVGWDRGAVEAALAHETAHGNRKGAIAALESALAEEAS